MSILPVFTVVHNDGTGDAFNRSADIAAIQLDGGFGDNVAFAMTDENLYGDFRILRFFVCQVNKGTGNTVSHLVRVARIYFFKHNVILSLRGADAPSDHPAELHRRIPCCSFL